jgi:hypothetical protein
MNDLDFREKKKMLNGRIAIYGRANSAAGYEVRDFLTRNCSDYDWVELNTDDEAQRLGLRRATHFSG